MPSVVLEWLSERWSVGAKYLPEKVDVIVMATMAATPEKLTEGSEAILETVKKLLLRYPEARLVFGVYAFSADPAVEEAEKYARLPLGCGVYTGRVRNTDHEATLAASVAPDANRILAVTDDWHSRSFAYGFRRAYRALGKSPEIYVWAVPAISLLSSDNPIFALRSHGRWALANVVRHLFMRCVPFSRKIMLETNLVRQPGVNK